MDQRFSQFEELVNNCEYGTSEKPVTCADLQGFWDMIYVQVSMELFFIKKILTLFVCMTIV